MADEDEPGASYSCGDPEHEGRAVRKHRRVSGERAQYACIADDGTRHFFTAGGKPRASHRPTRHAVACPRPGHSKSRVQYKGVQVRSTGSWRRYLCHPENDKQHYFSLLVQPDGTALSSVSVAPECPEHAGSKVVRGGSQGKGDTKRQRYRCRPTDGTDEHYFTPPLGREKVDVGHDACATCHDLLTPHQGEMAVARASRWTLRDVVASLNDLSLGASYANVSLDLRRRAREMDEHLSAEHGDLLLPHTPLEAASSSWTRRQGKTAWHLAADLVEQYSPLLFAHVIDEVKKREAALRKANNRRLGGRPASALRAPITYVLDELPIVVSHSRKSAAGALGVAQSRWNLLMVVETLWHDDGHPASLPTREARLRLVRAYPRSNADAWKLVLHEIGTVPDFVIADCASAIENAVEEYYGAGVVPLIPSFFHIHRNVRDKLLELPQLTVRLDGRAVLAGPLVKHLDYLTRDEMTKMSATDWTQWWGDLADLVVAHGGPGNATAGQRTAYEAKVAAALAHLVRHPHLPASNAAVETRLRLTMDPFLENRKGLYRNLARTNYLLDLAVCRSQGLFRDHDTVSRLIKASNTEHSGWAPKARQVDDAQPVRVLPAGTPKPPPYSSLLNPLLVSRLLAQRLPGK